MMNNAAICPYQLDVQNYHLDGYGHVNNARYLEFLEAARWHFFRECGIWQALRELQLVVAHIDIAYRYPAKHQDILYIDTMVQTVQSRRVVLQQTIRRSDSSTAMVQAVITLMPTQAGKTFRLPEPLYSKLNQLKPTSQTHKEST